MCPRRRLVPERPVPEAVEVVDKRVTCPAGIRARYRVQLGADVLEAECVGLCGELLMVQACQLACRPLWHQR